MLKYEVNLNIFSGESVNTEAQTIKNLRAANNEGVDPKSNDSGPVIVAVSFLIFQVQSLVSLTSNIIFIHDIADFR